jgi:4-amino-4-deoxy-L-arabinose transferase-like glycosyltransferase
MILAAIILRLVVVASVFRATSTPTASYEQFGWEVGWVARSIALGHGFTSPFLPLTGPTALVPPLFTYVLGTIFRLFGLYSASSAVVVLLFNTILSALTVIPIYLSAKLTLNTRAARIAGWAWAVYPFSVYFSAARVWEYALTALLFSLCFRFAQTLHLQRRVLAWVAFGLLYGVTALSNPSVASVLPFFLLLALYRLHRSGGRWLLSGLAATLAFIAVLLPWTLRNEHRLHAAFPVRDGFWLEAYAGNNGDTSDSNPAWAHPASSAAEMRRYQSLGEVRYLAEKRALTLHFVAAHPAFTAWVSARRALRFWTGFWSLSPTYLAREPLDAPNIVFCTAVTLLMLRGLRHLWQRDPGAALPYLILLAVFPLTYYLTHSSMDYRQPIEPEIIVLVAIGLTRKPAATSSTLEVPAEEPAYARS